MLRATRMVIELFGSGARWKLVGLFGLILMMAFVQTVGVASILPFMNLVAQPEAIYENPWLEWAYRQLGFETPRAFLLFAGLVVLGITAFSNAFSALTDWALVRFMWNRNYQISVQLLEKYLREPYSFFLNRNSADLAKNVLTEVREAINGFFAPMIKALAQAMVAVCIIALLLWVDVVLALVCLLVLGGSYGVIYVVVRHKQMVLGQRRLAAEESRFKAAGEAFGGIKELKVLGRERELVNRFSRPALEYSRTVTMNALTNQIPRYALETVAFGGILVLVLYVLGTQEDFGQAVAVMSLYALAGYRLMPALQQIFSGFTKARFFSAGLENLHDELVGSAGRSQLPSSQEVGLVESVKFERDILMDRISFSYNQDDKTVLRKVSLRIEKDTTIGLAGGTGSGKTTLVDILIGLLDAQEGCVRVDGVPLNSTTFPAWQRRIGYVPQHIYLLDDSICRNIAFGLPDEEIDAEQVQRAARIAHIHDFILSLPAGYKTLVGERGVRLSGGQRQRIGIARAVYHDPDVLVMDEATSSLDGITEDAVIDAIRELASQKTIVLVAHRLDTLRDCQMIHLFQDGRIVARGSYTELMETNVQFRSMAKGGIPSRVGT